MLAATRHHHQRRLAVEKGVRIKDDRRCVGLFAVDDEGVGGRGFFHDGVGQRFGTEHRFKAGKRDMRGDEEDGQGEGYADGGGKVFAFDAQQPAHGRPHEQSDGGQDGGQAESGKRSASEVKEVRHGERIIAHAAVGQHGADVGHKGQAARIPQAPAEGRCGEHADDGKDRLRVAEPGRREQRFAAQSAI